MAGTVLTRKDQMLLFFLKAKPGIYPVAPTQVDIIKENWQELHVYCNTAEFTFSSDYTKIRKDMSKKYEHTSAEADKALRIGSVSDRLYAFLYNSCIHESSWATISLHYSKEGAEKAMEEHKQKALDEFNEMYANNNKIGFKFGEHEDWCVEPVEVLP